MRLFRTGVLLLAGLGGMLLPPPAGAQTRADSAAIVLEAARTLAGQGESGAARQLFLLIRERYAGTEAARLADSLLGRLAGTRATGNRGHTGFVLFHTLYGAFLGAAIPAALGADGSEPYGAGLLIGAPLGFFASRAFATARIRLPGQAGLASFATAWGTWQGLAIQQMLDLGEREVCGEFGCFTDESDTAPWTAMVLGGLAGLGTGLALATREIPSATSTLISHSALWGSWFGYAIGFAAGAEGDAAIGTTLAGGNAGLLLAIPLARRWQTSSARIRYTTAAGLAGALAGFGIDLIAQPDNDRVVAAIPAATSALGLILGAYLTRNERADDGPGGALALLTLRQGVRLGFPLPLPTALRTDLRQRPLVPGFKLLLLDAAF